MLDQLQGARRTHDTVASATSAAASETLVVGEALGVLDDGADLGGMVSAEHRGADAPDPAAADGGWQPVPVPPPTYTLKPKAPVVRRPVADAAGLAVDMAEAEPAGSAANPARSSGGQRDDVPPAGGREPEPAAPAFDLDEILERRIASGS